MFTFGPSSRGDGDPKWGQVVLLLQGGAATDRSSFARTLTQSGVTENSATYQKNGVNSINIGPAGYLTWVRNANELLLAGKEFCLEGWYNYVGSTNGANRYYYNDGVGGTSDALSLIPNVSTSPAQTETRRNGGAAVAAGPSVATPGERYFCAERVGDNLWVSINGVVTTAVSLGAAFTFATPTHDTRIGQAVATTSAGNMYVAQMRLTVGANRYGGASFTPPAALFPIG